MVIIGFLGFRYYQSVKLKDTSEDFVDSFLNDSNIGSNNNNNNTNSTGNVVLEGVTENKTTESGSSGKKQQFNGYDMSGTIEIPATNVKLPILAQSALSKSGLETSVIEIYGNGLNEVGNTTIAGHNYRNGLFFSNNKKLKNGDEIIITDQRGEKVTYIIYNMYQTTSNDAEYMTRDTQGRREISLQTCTDDSKDRLIIWAAEKGSM